MVAALYSEKWNLVSVFRGKKRPFDYLIGLPEAGAKPVADKQLFR